MTISFSIEAFASILSTLVGLWVVYQLSNQTKALDQEKTERTKTSILIAELIQFMNGRGLGFNPLSKQSDDTVASQSPITLTEKGEEIAKHLNSKPLVDKYVDSWLELIDVPEDASKLAIQELCFSFCDQTMFDSMTKAEEEPIIEAIYKDGGRRTQTTRVYGVLLRDKVFMKRGITIPQRKTF